MFVETFKLPIVIFWIFKPLHFHTRVGDILCVWWENSYLSALSAHACSFCERTHICIQIHCCHKCRQCIQPCTRMCLYHPATRMWLYPKPRVLDTATLTYKLYSVVHIKFLKKNSNLQWNYKDYGHDLGLGLGLGLVLGLGLGLGLGCI